MSKMSDLDIKTKEFLGKCKIIKKAQSRLKDLYYILPCEDTARQEKIDQAIYNTENKIQQLRKNLPTFTKEEWSLLPKFDIVNYIKICPFCSSNIIHFSNEIVCRKCGYVFYEE